LDEWGEKHTLMEVIAACYTSNNYSIEQQVLHKVT
jgi:hypothetical protein